MWNFPCTGIRMLLFIYGSCGRAVQVLHTLVSALRALRGMNPRLWILTSSGWGMGNGADSEGDGVCGCC